MTTIELVVHCWSQEIPEYASLLTAQLSSLVLWPPKECVVNVVVCWTPSDNLTLSVVNAFERHFIKTDGIVRLHPLPLSKSHIFRRGIGRNEAFLRTDADIVWAADCDALFLDGCLDALAASDFTGLAYPRQAMFHKTHALGDEDLDSITAGQLWNSDPSRFEPRRIGFASGGYIIVDRETARKGFLDGTKWVKPANPEGGFIDPREDRVYRGLFKTSTRLDLPNLVRFRHSACAFQSAEKRLAQTEGKT